MKTINPLAVLGIAYGEELAYFRIVSINDEIYLLLASVLANPSCDFHASLISWSDISALSFPSSIDPVSLFIIEHEHTISAAQLPIPPQTLQVDSLLPPHSLL